MDPILERYETVHESIAQAAQAVGRSSSDIRMVVVTKNHPIEQIETLAAAGVRDFGENRIEEALEKIATLAKHPDLRWHMIGHIQSRKTKMIRSEFHLIHSVDRVKLASRLDSAADEAGVAQQILLQFNVSGEQTKSGWDASHPYRWEVLLPEVEAVLQCQSLRVNGLMTMAPYSTNPEDARQSFVQLRKLRDFLAARYPGQDWQELSMGMSGDYQVAIQEGATIVRIGTAILGPRY